MLKKISLLLFISANLNTLPSSDEHKKNLYPLWQMVVDNVHPKILEKKYFKALEDSYDADETQLTEELNQFGDCFDYFEQSFNLEDNLDNAWNQNKRNYIHNKKFFEFEKNVCLDKLITYLLETNQMNRLYRNQTILDEYFFENVTHLPKQHGFISSQSIKIMKKLIDNGATFNLLENVLLKCSDHENRNYTISYFDEGFEKKNQREYIQDMDDICSLARSMHFVNGQ